MLEVDDSAMSRGSQAGFLNDKYMLMFIRLLVVFSYVESMTSGKKSQILARC